MLQVYLCPLCNWLGKRGSKFVALDNCCNFHYIHGKKKWFPYLAHFWCHLFEEHPQDEILYHAKYYIHTTGKYEYNPHAMISVNKVFKNFFVISE